MSFASEHYMTWLMCIGLLYAGLALFAFAACKVGGDSDGIA